MVSSLLVMTKLTSGSPELNASHIKYRVVGPQKPDLLAPPHETSPLFVAVVIRSIARSRRNDGHPRLRFNQVDSMFRKRDPDPASRFSTTCAAVTRSDLFSACEMSAKRACPHEHPHNRVNGNNSLSNWQASSRNFLPHGNTRIRPTRTRL